MIGPALAGLAAALALAAPPLATRAQAGLAPYELVATWAERPLFAPDGRLITREALPLEPQDVALDADDRLYVADGASDRVRVYDFAAAPTGGETQVAAWTPPVVAGSGLQRRLVPLRLAADRARGRVHILWRMFDQPEGYGGLRMTSAAWLESRDGSGQALGPARAWTLPATTSWADIATDPTTGEVVALVEGRCSLYRFPAAGGEPTQRALTLSSGCQGRAHIAFGSDGYLSLIVRTSFGTQVSRVSPVGDEVGSYALQRGSPQDLSAGPNGTLHVLANPAPSDPPLPLLVTFDAARRQQERRVLSVADAVAPPGENWEQSVDRSGDVVAFTHIGTERITVHWQDLANNVLHAVPGVAGRIAPSYGISPSDLVAPDLALAGRPGGGVIAVDQRAAEVYAYDASGRPERVAARPEAARDVALAPDGTLFVAGPDRLDRLGNGAWTQSCQCGNPPRLTVGAELVFVNQRAPRAPLAFNLSGTPLGILQRRTPEDDWPADFAADARGWLLAANYEHPVVESWPLSGSTLPDLRLPPTTLTTDSRGGILRLAAARTAEGDRVAVLAGQGRGFAAQLYHGVTGGRVASVPLWTVLPATDAPRDVALDGAGRLYVAGRSGAIYVFAPRGSTGPNAPTPTPRATPPPPDPATACRVSGDTAVAPARIRLGATARVTLTLDISCPKAPRSRGADIVLVLDSSGSMAGEKLTAAKAAARSFAGLIDTRLHRLAVVDFDGSARLVVPLTRNASDVNRAIGDLTADSGTNILDALQVAAEHIRDAGLDTALPVVVLLTDGQSSPEELIIRQALEMRAQGILLHTIGLGTDVNGDLLRAVAGSDGRYHRAPSPNDLAGIYAGIRNDLDASIRPPVGIEDLLAEAIAYVPGSSLPAALEAAGALGWSAQLDASSALQWTAAFDVRPGRGGLLPVHARAEAEYVDTDDATRHFAFPQRFIEVLVDTPTPSTTPLPSVTTHPSATPTLTVTPSPTAPPSATGTPSPTPTATRTRRPTATRTPVPRPILLPLLLRETACTARERRISVALVIDASTSMGEPAPGGGTKLDAARAAVREFVRQLRLAEGDRAAIVAFNARATVLAHLTSNTTVLDRALASITLAPQTRLELAIAAAHTELVAGRGPVGNRPVTVLLTDGRSNPSTPAEAIASADAARRDRVDIYVVGLGADLDLTALQRIAGSPDRFFRAPTATDLAGIYARLIQRIPCDGGRYWGRR